MRKYSVDVRFSPLLDIKSTKCLVKNFKWNRKNPPVKIDDLVAISFGNWSL